MMLLKAKAKPEDDAAYVTLVSRIVGNAVRAISPYEIFVIQIDSWFDHKWLEFSGKAVGALGVWEDRLTVPPFHPHRVLAETHALVTNSEELELSIEPTRALHRQQNSGENLNRKIINISQSALFVWYSSNTQTTDKASLMVYKSTADGQFGWYASFDRKNSWAIHQLKGVSKSEMLTLMEEDGV